MIKVTYGSKTSSVSTELKGSNWSVCLRDLGLPATNVVGTVLGVYHTSGPTVTYDQYDRVTIKDSSNTPGTPVEGTTAGFILWNPYRQEAIRTQKEPTLRRYNPPKFTKKRPVWIKPEEPVRSSKSSDEQWRMSMIRYEDLVSKSQKDFEIRLQKWTVKHAAWQKKLASYDARYSRSVARFKRLLNAYLRRLTLPGFAGVKRLKVHKRYTHGNLYSLLEIKGPVMLKYRRRITYNSLANAYAACYENEMADVPAFNSSAYTTPSLIDALKHLSTRFDDRLKKQAIGKLKGGSVDGGILLGESRETAKLIVQILQFLNHLRSNPALLLKQAISLDKAKLHQVADLYLTYKFGVAPLLEDLSGLFKLLNSEETIIGEVKVKVGMKTGLDMEVIPLWNPITVSGSLQITRTYRYSIDNPFHRVMSTLGLVNPFQVGWELLPLSFVFDWFYDIGGFLESQTATSGLIALEAWETIDVQGYGSQGGVVGENKDSNAFVGAASAFPNVETITYQRTASFGSAPVRIKIRRKISTDLDLDLPQIKLGDWPLSKLITSAALLIQRLPRSK